MKKGVKNVLFQGSYMLEKYLNMKGFLEKSLKKWNMPWKELENHYKALKSTWILLFSVRHNPVNVDYNKYKIVVPLFGAA